MPSQRQGLRVVLLGAPGVGKGTQAAAIVARAGVPHIATGDMLRAAMRGGSALGARIRALVERGELVPDELVGELVKERLARDDARGGFLLDGFPRTVAQALFLDEVLRRRGQRLDRVVNLVVPESEIVERLSGRRVCGGCGANYHVRFRPSRVPGRCDACGGELRQRADDAPEVVKERLRVYQEQTAPVADHYRAAGILAPVDGTGAPEEVAARIAAALPGPEE